MRLRFFFVILVVLIVVAAGTIALHTVFLRKEQLQLIDQQVREAAVALLDSDLNEPRRLEIGRVENIISEELGENRIGKFFVIRNEAGETIFESTSARLLTIPKIPQQPQWIGIHEKGKYFRILNLALPKIPNRTLQVGLVIDDKLLKPGYLSSNVLGFVALALGLGLVVAWLLASFLTKPISSLAEFIETAAQDPDVGKRLPKLPESVRSIGEDAADKPRDELARLIVSFDRLIERVNRGYNVSRFWSYQMAHELKTPMAVVEALVNRGVHERKVSEEYGSKVLNEVFDVSETISSFLSWAEVESSPSPKRQYVMRPSRVLSSVTARLSQVHGTRIMTHIDHDFSILGNLQQLEQLLTNLIQNACNYSPQDKPVVVRSFEHSISIRDEGRGIPSAVLEKLGEPFNRGEINISGQKSTGLGLAYSQSVCWLHGWRMTVHSDTTGTEILIRFPVFDEDVGLVGNA